jgi:deoxyribonuclease-4
MLKLGAHESIAGGMHKAFDRAQSVGCDAVQIFVKPNRAWAVKPLTTEDIDLFKAKAVDTGVQPVIGQTIYCGKSRSTHSSLS